MRRWRHGTDCPADQPGSAATTQSRPPLLPRYSASSARCSSVGPDSPATRSATSNDTVIGPVSAITAPATLACHALGDHALGDVVLHQDHVPNHGAGITHRGDAPHHLARPPIGGVIGGARREQRPLMCVASAAGAGSTRPTGRAGHHSCGRTPGGAHNGRSAAGHIGVRDQNGVGRLGDGMPEGRWRHIPGLPLLAVHAGHGNRPPLQACSNSGRLNQ